MHTAMNRWGLLVGVGLLLAAEPPAPPSLPLVPNSLPQWNAGGSPAPSPQQGDWQSSPLPPPRRDTTSLPLVPPGNGGGTAGQPTPAPAGSGPALDEPNLPAPRALPTGPPVEEPAPAPREQSGPAPNFPPPLNVPPLPPNAAPPAFGPPNAAPPALGREEAAPLPREQTPSPPPLFVPGLLQPAPFAELRALHHETESLHLECEAMLREEMELATAKDLKANKDDDPAQLRQRIMQLLVKAAAQKKQQAAAPEPPATRSDKSTTPPTPKTSQPKTTPSAPSTLTVPLNSLQTSKPPTPGKQADNSARVLTEAPVDPQSLAQSLFLAGEYEAALAAYRKLEQEEPKIEDRIVIQYMQACCLRKLGKLEEAAVLYREVANSGGNEILVENAQWYLRAMKERRELETQLDQLRQRRQAVVPRKP
jgi:tetratricopeptide (TPR) repeat protein